MYLLKLLKRANNHLFTTKKWLRCKTSQKKFSVVVTIGSAETLETAILGAYLVSASYSKQKWKHGSHFFINSGGETLFLLELFSEESCLVLMEHECRYVKRKYSYYVYKCTMLYLYFITLVLRTWACSRESSVWKKQLKCLTNGFGNCTPQRETQPQPFFSPGQQSVISTHRRHPSVSLPASVDGLVT